MAYTQHGFFVVALPQKSGLIFEFCHLTSWPHCGRNEIKSLPWNMYTAWIFPCDIAEVQVEVNERVKS
jgi:hypothetical protein